MIIKPCPFCGKPGRLRGSNNVCGSPFYYIECVNINCMASTAGQETKKKAIEQWNRRAYESIGTADDA